MSEDDREDMEDVMKLIQDGYTKVTGILEHKATLGEIRGFMAGYLLLEKDSDFETFISIIKDYRDIIKSDTHE